MCYDESCSKSASSDSISFDDKNRLMIDRSEVGETKIYMPVKTEGEEDYNIVFVVKVFSSNFTGASSDSDFKGVEKDDENSTSKEQ